MCGIFGFTGFDRNDLSHARESLHTLKHRGPDQWNDYFDDTVYLGHQRLSILDLSEHGRQPMSSPDGNVIITVNGEIYNFRQLKEELEEKYYFQSTSDSEVVLYGYIEWGIEKLLERIDGMYAFCIYDRSENKVYLCRDRVGIKPIYYSTLGESVSWASELKTLEKFYSRQTLVYDYTACYDFLTYLYVPTPKTIYQGIHKLEPAHYLTIDIASNHCNKTRYWELPLESSYDDFETVKTTIYNLVLESVNEQMVSDVPVGFFLSGGMDSSVVVALASQQHNDIHTFSIGFDDKQHDETVYAKLVAEQCGTVHQSKTLSIEDADALFPNIIKWYDEPFADTSCFPTYLVSKFAKETTTVVLTGDGGDEIFGGYNWYKEFERTSRCPFPQRKRLKKLLAMMTKRHDFFGRITRAFERRFLYDDFERYTKLLGGMTAEEKETYRKRWNISEGYDDYWYFRKYYRKDLDLYTRLQYMDFHTYLPDDILTKVDRTSMAVSLECRVPLLSRKLIEYLFSLPVEMRLYNNELKGIMKRTFASVLPYQIVERDKQGFSIPMVKWKSQLLGSYQYKQEKILGMHKVSK